MNKMRIALTFCFLSTFFLQSSFSQNLIISGGGRFSVAKCDNGTVRTWGENSQGQLGNGTTGTPTSVPTPIVFPNVPTTSVKPTIVAIDGGSGSHTVALDCDGHVWAWGDNCEAQIGNGQGGRTLAQVRAAPLAGCGTSQVVNTPSMVLRGAQPAGTGNDATYLHDIVYVSSGNRASYAVDAAGNVWSWGSNIGIHFPAAGTDWQGVAGLLGNNNATMDFSPVPVKVVQAGGAALPAIIQVDATDNGVYALDVNGNVWAWGINQNGQLGNGVSAWGGGAGANDFQLGARRVLAGTYVNSASQGPTGNLSNIIQITAGDTHGLFLDVFGNVWSVGAAYTGIGGFTGGGGADAVYAAKVNSGNSTAITGDAVFLAGVDPYVASQGAIAATQVGNAAVVSELLPNGNTQGYLYTWGINFSYNLTGETQADLGGQLGQGTCSTTGTGSSVNTPTLVTTFYRGNTPVDYRNINVIGVSDGDGVIYVVTQDNTTLAREIYVMGANNRGQLGIGAGRTGCYPTLLDLGCTLSDPCPVANLGPDTVYVCGTWRDTLVSPGIAKSYRYSWTYYSNPSATTGGVVTTKVASTDATANTFIINGTTAPPLGLGKYVVEISRLNASCDECPIAKDSVYVLAYPTTFTAPTDLTFCGNSGSVRVNSTSSTNPSYSWFPTQASTTVIGKSVGSGTISIDLTAATNGPNGAKIVYVEEKNFASGRVMPTAPCAGTSSNSNLNGFYTRLTVYEDIVIDSVDILPCNTNGGASNASNWQASVYPSRLDGNGRLIPNTMATELVGATYSLPAGLIPANSCLTTPVSIPVKITLKGSPTGSIYFLRLKTGGDYTLFSCAGTAFPVIDNVPGIQIVDFAASVENGTNQATGYRQGFYNMQFTTVKQKFCDRVPVTLRPQCPCNRPKSVTITSPTAPNLLTCAGATGVSLQGTYVDSLAREVNVNLGDSSMSYVWYKKKTGKPVRTDYAPFSYTVTAPTFTVGTVVGSGTANPFVDPVTAADTGVWVLRVQHGNTPSASGCYREDSVHVQFLRFTKPEIKDTTLAMCQGDSRLFSLAATNVSGSTYAWTVSNGTPTTGAGTTLTVTAGSVSPLRFTLQETNTSTGCKGPIGTGTVKVDLKPLVPTISTNGGADITMCGTDQQLAIDPTSRTVGKVTWTTNGTGISFTDNNNAGNTRADTLATTNAKGFSNATGTAKFVVTVRNGSCPATKDSINVTRSGELTTPNLKSDNIKLTVCLGGNLSFTGNARSGGNLEVSRWAWSPTASVVVDSGGAANNNKATYTFTALGNYDISYIIDNPTCPEKRETLTITVVAPATAVITDPSTVNTTVPIKEKSINPSNYQLLSQAAGIGYTGSWSIKTGQGTISSTGALTGLTNFETNPSTLVGTTDVYWTVTENTSSCPAAKDSARIIRRDMTIPDLGPDTVKCTSSLPFTRRTNVGDTIPGIETVVWSGQTSFVQGNDIVVPAGTAPGTYTVSVTITNNATTPPTANPDNFTIIVQQPVDAILNPTVTNPRTTCAKSVQLPGGISPALSSATGTWKISATSPQSATIVTPSDSISNLSNLVSPSTVNLWWVVQNGVCPKDSVEFTVIQAGEITTPEIIITGGIYANDTITNGSADTLCTAVSYTLTSSAPNGIKNETAFWTLIDQGGTGITVSGDLTTQAITSATEGVAEISWTINPDPAIPGCQPETATARLRVYAPPVITSVTGPTAFPCEDATAIATSQVAFTSTLTNSAVSWTIAAGGTAGATLVTGNNATAAFNNFTSTAPRGTRDSIAVAVRVTNACAFDSENKNIAFNLKPRELFKGDTIAGPTQICESYPGVGYWFDHAHPNTTKIQWYWNNTPVYLGLNDPTDTAGYAQSLWGDINVVTTATVRAELGNVCGFKKDTSITVTVIPAVDFSFNAVSDKIQDSYCIPLDNVGIWAQQTAPDSLVYGSVAQYAFLSTRGGTVLQAQSDSRVFRSRFLGDTSITVVAYPQLWACLKNYDPVSDIVNLKGYNTPTDTLSYTSTTVCDNTPVKLYFQRPTSKNLGDLTWYKTSVTGATSIYRSGINEVDLTGADATGTYFVFIENALKKIDPTTQCPGDTTNKVAVKIYETPKPAFSTSDLLIFYNESDPGVPMPLATIGTRDSLIKILYNPGTWLSKTDTLYPLIKTTEDEITIQYVLELQTGDISKGVTCPGQAVIRVINTLPLLIPNAFSPNGDGKNEVWVIDGLGQYPDTRVKVFNRWGGAMYTDNYGYKSPWDGTHNGVPLASGTYYYVIELKGSPTGKEEVRTGSLTIVR